MIYEKKTKKNKDCELLSLLQWGIGVMVFNATFNKLYHGIQFYWWRKPEYLEKTTDLPQIDKLYHTMLY